MDSYDWPRAAFKYDCIGIFRVVPHHILWAYVPVCTVNTFWERWSLGRAFRRSFINPLYNKICKTTLLPLEKI